MNTTTWPRPLPAWPDDGVSRAPYGIYADEEIHALEQARIFRGPTWHFLAMEAQLPDPGCFVQAQLGDTPVVVTRDAGGEIHALVNRCSHRGTPLVFRQSGRAPVLTCLYHNWCYGLDGTLRAVPLERGLRGRGGMPAGFDKAQHGLRRLRLHRIAGLVFGTLDPQAPDFEADLGPELTANVRRVCGSAPLVPLGEYRQLLHANWKLYIENARDPYHAFLLHGFNAAMKLDGLVMHGGIEAGGPDGRHHLFRARADMDPGGEFSDTSADRGAAPLAAHGAGLRDKEMAQIWDEHGDGIAVAVQSVFPCFVLQQLRNALALRILVPLGPSRTELRWIVFGRADDDPRQRRVRLKQANLIGPAGFLSIEDPLVVHLIQRGLGRAPDGVSLMRMGGDGAEPTPGTRATEAGLRGFWKGYRALMGL